jgi:hypothetical protein
VGVDVPEVKPLTSGVARAEERVSATQQLCNLLGAGSTIFINENHFVLTQEDDIEIKSLSNSTKLPSHL